MLATLPVTACSSTKEKPLVISTAKAPPPEPTFSRQDPVEAFLGFAHALATAEETLDVNYPGLRTYGQSAALADIQSRIRTFKAQGLRLAKPQVVTGAAIVARGTDKGRQVVKVRACKKEPADDLVDVKTGKPRPPAGATSQPAATAVWEAIVVLMDDGWHVDGGTVTDTRTCSGTV
jgi:hypothetical protein